jgi:2-polyprenylphenol 6-hydroxylase
MNQSVPHVAIVGAGPVGLALALALERVQVTLIDRQVCLPIMHEALDARVYAVAPRHTHRLASLGVQLDPARSAEVVGMAVEIAGATLDLPAPADTQRLATILENVHLVDRCADAVRARNPACRWLLGEHLIDVRPSGAGLALNLTHGQTMEVDLLVGADGKHSDVRQLADIPTFGKSYGESAVVAHFATELSHQRIARQWFNAPGTLAWLPLPSSATSAQVSMVWSLPEGEAQSLLALDAVAFTQRVSQAGRGTLGAMTLISQPMAFPLGLTESAQPENARIVLIGDAAHTVHPLAGQGLNLGLGDAFALADAINARGPRSLHEVLPAYRRSRHIETTGVQMATDLLTRFAHRPALAPFLAFGVRRLDALTPLKLALAQLAGAVR